LNNAWRGGGKEEKMETYETEKIARSERVLSDTPRNYGKEGRTSVCPRGGEG